MAENSLASPGPLPVEIAAGLYTNRIMEHVRGRRDPETSGLRTDDDLRARVQAVAELACRLERARGSRPAGGPESATAQLKRANAASYGYFERGEYLTRLLFWHRVALAVVSATAVVCWLI